VHKVRTTLKFKSLEDYQLLKNLLDAAPVNFDSFVTECVNIVWNQMLEEYKEQEKARELASGQTNLPEVTVSMGESADTPQPEIGQADNAQEGGPAPA